MVVNKNKQYMGKVMLKILRGVGWAKYLSFSCKFSIVCMCQ